MSGIQEQSSLEAKALRFYEAGENIKRLEEERERIRAEVGNMMEVANMNEIRISLNEFFDIKIKISDRTSKKLDKQELANDLGVAESAINIEFLLKTVEDNKLSLARFKQYMFNETNENISIRKVNAEVKPDKKGA